jgi:hypothetical protein
MSMRGVDARGRDLFRLFRSTDPETGHPRAPFHFASRPDTSGSGRRGVPAGGRFDLVAPQGTCYLADTRIGAWVEVFRGTRMVDNRDARARSLLRTRAPRRVLLADLTDRSAIADALAVDFRGVQTWTRHDPSAGSRTVSLFDVAGSHPPFGWAWRQVVGSPVDDPMLLAELASCGLGVGAVPYDMPVTPPTALR